MEIDWRRNDSRARVRQAPLHDNFHTAKSIKADKFPIDGLKPKLICASARSRFRLNFLCLRLRGLRRVCMWSFHVSYLVDSSIIDWFMRHATISVYRRIDLTSWKIFTEKSFHSISAYNRFRGLTLKIKAKKSRTFAAFIGSWLCNLRTYHKRAIDPSTRDRRSKPLLRFRVDLFVSLVVVVACKQIRNHQNLQNFAIISKVSQLIKS